MRLQSATGVNHDGRLERYRPDDLPGVLQGRRQVGGGMVWTEHIDVGPKSRQGDDACLLAAAFMRLLALHTDGEIDVFLVARVHRILRRFVVPTLVVQRYERRMFARLLEEGDKAILLAAKYASQEASSHAHGIDFISRAHGSASCLRKVLSGIAAHFAWAIGYCFSRELF